MDWLKVAEQVKTRREGKVEINQAFADLFLQNSAILQMLEELKSTISKDWRDVQREAALECAKICEEGNRDNEQTCNSICHRRDKYSILERFNLEGK